MFYLLVLSFLIALLLSEPSLAADLGQHLVDGLLYMRGGATAAGLPLHSPTASHLTAQLIEGLCHTPARAYVFSTG